MKNSGYQGCNIGIRVDTFLNSIGRMLPQNNNVSIYYGKVLYAPKQQEEIKNLLQTIEDNANNESLLGIPLLICLNFIRDDI